MLVFLSEKTLYANAIIIGKWQGGTLLILILEFDKVRRKKFIEVQTHNKGIYDALYLAYNSKFIQTH